MSFCKFFTVFLYMSDKSMQWSQTWTESKKEKTQKNELVRTMQLSRFVAIFQKNLSLKQKHAKNYYFMQLQWAVITFIVLKSYEYIDHPKNR